MKICIVDMKNGQVIYHLRLKEDCSSTWSVLLETFARTTAGKFGTIVSHWERTSPVASCVGAIVTRESKSKHGTTFYLHQGHHLTDQYTEVERLRRHGLMMDTPYMWDQTVHDWVPGPRPKIAIDGPGELQEVFQSSRPFHLKHHPELSVFQNVYGALYWINFTSSIKCEVSAILSFVHLVVSFYTTFKLSYLQ